MGEDHSPSPDLPPSNSDDVSVEEEASKPEATKPALSDRGLLKPAFGGKMAEYLEENGISAVVGIGASAGGLSPLEELFRSLPSQTGAAYVVVQHLSPDFKSLMKELLTRHTEMPVERVEDGMPLRPNTVYLIPPKKNMVLQDGRFELIDQNLNPGHPPHYAIDVFFQSLAEQADGQGVAVILSGTGTDGTSGCRAVHEAGGLVLAQDPESAQFDGMPQSVINSGYAARVLPPAQLASLIVKVAEHPVHGTQIALDEPHTTEDMDVYRILRLLKEEDQADFLGYKINTLTRRIQRRMLVHGFNRYEQYYYFLMDDVEERATLRADLLIGVTSFFRDPEVWGYINQRIMRQLFELGDPNEPLRLWVTACSIGCEAYTLAMMLNDYKRQRKINRPIKIFATDIDTHALEIASNGKYPLSIEQEMPAEQLADHFQRQGDYYRIQKHLREMIIFAKHDLINDVPMTRMDMVTCRNVLIYMKPRIQQRVLSILHFSLRRDGYLLLGTSETPGDLAEEFDPVDKSHKIYRKTRENTLPLFNAGLRAANRTAPTVEPGAAAGAEPERQHVAQHALDSMVTEAYSRGLSQAKSASLLVNRKHEVIHAFGETSRFMTMQPGPATLEINRMVHESLAVPISAGLHRTFKEQKAVRYRGLTLVEGEPPVDLAIQYVPSRRTMPDFFIISLTQTDFTPPVGETLRMDDDAKNRIHELEEELQRNRENLQATIEELEATNEEQQATNEEMLASNEELQSTNEELHSVNEELHTVNSEYQAKIRELTELNHDLDNLFASTNIGTIFLDPKLHIRKFTPSAATVVPLVERDINRPIEHLSHRLQNINLSELAARVIESGKALEIQGDTHDERHILIRVFPYMTSTQQVQGAVLTFVDVSDLTKARRQVETAQANLQRRADELGQLNQTLLQFRAMVESSHDAIFAKDLDGVITEWNTGCTRIYGYRRDEILGMPVTTIIPEERMDEYREFTARLRKGEAVVELETVRVTKSGQLIDVVITISPFRNEQGEIIGMSTVCRDVSQARREAQRMLRDTEDRLNTLLQTAPDGIVMIDDHARIAFINPGAERLFGYESGELFNFTASVLLGESEADTSSDRFIVDPGETSSFQAAGRRRDGSTFPIRVSLGGFEQQGRRFVTAVIQDQTERQEAQAKVLSRERQMRLMADSLPVLIGFLDDKLKFQFCNAAFERLYRRDVDEILGTPLLNLLEPQDYRRFEPWIQRVQTDEPVQFEHRMSFPDGRERDMQCNLVPRVDTQGHVDGFYIMMFDISAVKQAEDRLVTLNHKLADRNREMEQFVYTVSHDLKAPLVTINGMLGFLKREIERGDQSRVEELAQTVEDTAGKMRDTIDSLLELSRIGRTSGEIGPVDLAEVAERIGDALQGRFAEANARLELATGLPTVQGDRDQIARVLENLFINAIKYGVPTPNGQTPCVSVDPLLNTPGYLGMVVRDNGPGIDPKFHDKVFELFQRLESGSEGSGVGLAIVRRIMEVHGGRTWLTSEPGHGAAFHLAFPISIQPQTGSPEPS